VADRVDRIELQDGERIDDDVGATTDHRNLALPVLDQARDLGKDGRFARDRRAAHDIRPILRQDLRHDGQVAPAREVQHADVIAFALEKSGQGGGGVWEAARKLRVQVRGCE
jgi:hypothetical protein